MRPRRLSALGLVWFPGPRVVLVVATLVALLGSVTLTAGQPAPVAAVTVAIAPDDYVLDALRRLNEERIAAGLPELTLDAQVREVAAERVLDMAGQGYFAHYGPDGKSAFSALADRAVPYGIVGENLARTTYPPDGLIAAVHAALMDSPGHRSNMLEPRFNRVGVAIAEVDGMYYIAYVFLD